MSSGNGASAPSTGFGAAASAAGALSRGEDINAAKPSMLQNMLSGARSGVQQAAANGDLTKMPGQVDTATGQQPMMAIPQSQSPAINFLTMLSRSQGGN